MQTLAGRLARSRVSAVPSAMPRPCARPRSASFFWSRSGDGDAEAAQRGLRRLARAADRRDPVERVTDGLGREAAAVIGVGALDGLLRQVAHGVARAGLRDGRRGREQRLLVAAAVEAVLPAQAHDQHPPARAAFARRAARFRPPCRAGRRASRDARGGRRGPRRAAPRRRRARRIRTVPTIAQSVRWRAAEPLTAWKRILYSLCVRVDRDPRSDPGWWPGACDR